MKVDLNLMERTTLLKILPKEGNVITIQMVRHLVRKVGVTSEEYQEYEIKETVDAQGTPMSQWNAAKGAIPKSYEFTDPEVTVIKRELDKLDKNNKLDQFTILIYEKFFP